MYKRQIVFAIVTVFFIIFISQLYSGQATPTTASSSTNTTTPAPSKPATTSTDVDTFDFDTVELDTPTPSKAAQTPTPRKKEEPDVDNFDFDFDQADTKPPKKPEPPQEEFGIPVSIPYLGDFLLIPFTDPATQKSGYKAKFADKDTKLTIGALTIDDGTISSIDNKFGISGRVSLFGKQAVFALKEAVKGDKNSLQKAVLGVTFTDQPALELWPGKPITLQEVTIELAKGKPIIVLASTTLFGQTMLVGFIMFQQSTGAFLNIPPTTKLVDLIPSVANTPLEQGIIKNAEMKINNVTGSAPFQALITGSIDLAQTALSDNPAALSDSAFNATITKQGIVATLTMPFLSLPNIGTIQDAKMLIDSTKTPAVLDLIGAMSLDISELGALDIKVQSTITPQGIIFSGIIPKEFNYADFSLQKDAKVTFDTKERVITINGDATLKGFNLKVNFTVQPDPANPQKRTLSVAAHGKGDEFIPFAATKIPVLDTFKVVNFDIDVSVEKKNGKTVAQLELKDDLIFLGRSLKSIVRFVSNEQGETGVYIDAPLTKGQTLADFFPELKGPVFEGLRFNQASFFASSINFFDPVKKMMIKRGLSFLGEVPLTGTLQPIGDLLGIKETAGKPEPTFTMAGKITPEDPTLSEFSILLAQGTPDPSKKFSFGNMAINISGRAEISVNAEVIVRPTPEEQLLFAGAFGFKEGTAVLKARMDGSWINAFGRDGWLLKNPALQAALVLGTPGFPKEVGGTAILQIKDYLNISIAFLVDAALKNMAFEGTADEISYSKLLGLLGEVVGITLPIVDIPGIRFYDIHAKYASQDTTIGNTTITRGIAAASKLDVLGQTAEVDAQLDSGGLKAYGGITPIDLGGIITMTGRGTKKKPEVDIELTLLRQIITITGILNIAGIYKKETFFQISPDGIEFNFEDSLGGDTFRWRDESGKEQPLLLSQVHGISKGSFFDPDFIVTITFQQYLKKFILNQIEQSFEKARQTVSKSFTDAQDRIDTAHQAAEAIRRDMEVAEQTVAEQRKALDAIKQAQAQVAETLRAAQEQVDTLKQASQRLDEEYQRSRGGS